VSDQEVSWNLRSDIWSIQKENQNMFLKSLVLGLITIK